MTDLETKKQELRAQIISLGREYARLQQSGLNSEVAKGYVPASGKLLGEAELVNMLDASLDMHLTAQRFNQAFEAKLASRVGVRYAMTTVSGSAANLLAMTALTSPLLGERRLKPGDEVLSVAAGFPTTVNPIVQNGLIPVFMDVAVPSYNVAVSELKKAISPKTKAIFLAHTLGSMYDMDAVMELASEHQLWVIEDMCDALGASWQSKNAGTFGHLATCSFYPAHHITTGEGGAVLTQDPLLRRIVLSLRDWGRDCWCSPGCDNTCTRRFDWQLGLLPQGYDHKYTYSHVGYNLKLTDWQAAIGLAQIDRLDEFLALRRRHAAFLQEALSDLTQWFILPEPDPRCESAWFGFLLSVRADAPFTRNEVVQYLEAHGVGTRLLFAGNILRQPMFTTSDIALRLAGESEARISSQLGEADFARLPGTEFIMNHTFWVGVAHNLTDADLKKTSDVLHAFIKEKCGG